MVTRPSESPPRKKRPLLLEAPVEGEVVDGKMEWGRKGGKRKKGRVDSGEREEGVGGIGQADFADGADGEDGGDDGDDEFAMMVGLTLFPHCQPSKDGPPFLFL